MKIAIVLITLLIVAAAFLTLLNQSGDTVKGANDDTEDKLDCVMKDKEDAQDCRDDASSKHDMEVRDIEA